MDTILGHCKCYQGAVRLRPDNTLRRTCGSVPFTYHYHCIVCNSTFHPKKKQKLQNMTVQYEYLTADECEDLKKSVKDNEHEYNWGSYGRNGEGILNARSISDLETSHLENILITQRHLSNELAAAILMLIKKRYHQQSIVNMPKPKLVIRPEPRGRRCVHTEHCCVEHGCKYGEEDCPVVTGRKRQSYLCEMCDNEN